jgi:hypothetical protein
MKPAMLPTVDPKVLAKVVKYIKAHPNRLEFKDITTDVGQRIQIMEPQKGDDARSIGIVDMLLGDVLVTLFKAALKAADVKATRHGYRLPVAAPSKRPTAAVKAATTKRAAIGAPQKAARIPVRKRAANGRKKAGV